MGYNIPMQVSAPMIGKAGELRVRSELLIRGISCGALDFDDGTDIVLSNGKKIGVKTANRPSKDEKSYSWRYSFSVRVPQIREAKNGLYTKKFTKRDYEGYVDFWVFWCIQDDIFYIIPNGEVGQKVSFVISTPREKRIYKKHKNEASKSKYERFKNNWDLLR